MDNKSSGGYELTVLMSLGFRAAIDELHRQLASSGFEDVRPAHGFVFQRLAPHGATGNEIAEHMGITKQAASQMIDYLEEHGYVKRHSHPRDGRGKIVVLTERGWGCIQATERIFAGIERRWTDLLGRERMDELRTDLRRLIQAAAEEGHPVHFRPVW
ncbi:MarR family transcriptional regulator [Paenibacillus tyrfis]|uniref:MarR family winged helix-turn-helix transcriptional regulator n=1 Tax=Paenibacillus tyrfis TaxID=1501230 RepID=UPI0024912975|nr:MarR family winged helix-turn-helix transcriptional regulator [Paenibacillus tyrfis]GLI10264.1 MarR family transcriptional regulator [Paenibacillus tyrfis]